MPESDNVRDRRIAQFLSANGCDDIVHPGGTLAQHLHRTAETLRAWGAPPHLVDAGRLHAAYGTEGFRTPIAGAPDKSAVDAVVGPEAEALIRLYCQCDRERSYATWTSEAPVVFDRHTGAVIRLGGAERTMLIELTVANELDVLSHSKEIAARYGAELRELFTKWRDFLSDGANAACRDHESFVGADP
jgi:hypothetical protein